MLLSKEIAVELNHTGCRLKQFIAAKLRKAQVPLTPEQFMLIDLLWNHGAMSQQQLADMMKKDKNSVTQLIDAKERKGFVLRQQNAQDRRSNTKRQWNYATKLSRKEFQFWTRCWKESVKRNSIPSCIHCRSLKTT